ncbi:MAG: Xaa-Pro peptidase family protein [Patescibacteria group bacterium]
MSSRFGPDFFRRNRERLVTLFAGTAPIVLTANGRLQQAGSEPYPFEQDGSFWYFTGLDQPDFVLVLDKGKEFIILPKQSDYLNLFEGGQSLENLQNYSGIADILDWREGNKRLEARLKRVKHVATIAPAPAFVEVYGMYANPSRAALVDRMKSVNSSLEILDLKTHVAKLRMVKQPEELTQLRQAIKITYKSLQRVTGIKISKFSTTFEIETELLRQFRSRGADGEAFESVIISGTDTCVIHGHASKKPITSRGAFLLDVGARVNKYCADVSRTYFLGGAAKRHRQVHTAVIEVYDYAKSLLKPGVVIRTYEKEVEQYMGEKLRELGLIKSLERENIRKYFPHATSHFLGIDVHDAGDYDSPISKNVTLTIEPGIYIPEEGFGVRIEDDFIITDNSCQLLVDGLPLTLD